MGLAPRKKPGPKPKPAEELKRSSITFRVMPDLRSALLASADAAGRSLSEELEHRLAVSLRDEEMLGPMNTQLVGRTISAAIFVAEKDRKQPWHNWPRGEAREIAIDALQVQFGQSPRWLRLWKLHYEALIKLSKARGCSLAMALHNALGAGILAIWDKSLGKAPSFDLEAGDPNAQAWVRLAEGSLVAVRAPDGGVD